MLNPLISIIIPVFNGESFLNNCFANLNSQSYKNLDIIFIDNNSSDKSFSLIKKYCARKKNVRLLTCEIQGPSATRNVGLREAKGEYLTFLDVDDEILPNKFHCLLKAFKKYPSAVMVFGKIKKIYDDGRVIQSNYDELINGLNTSPEAGLLWLKQFQFNPHLNSIMVKKKHFNKEIKFPENLFFGEDIAFNVLIGLSNDVVKIDEIVAIYKRHSRSTLSQANKILLLEERFLQFYENFSIPYFFKHCSQDIFKFSLEISKNIAFRLREKLLLHNMSNNKKVYLSTTYIYNSYKYYFFNQLFKIFPYRLIIYIYDFYGSIIEKRLRKKLKLYKSVNRKINVF